MDSGNNAIKEIYSKRGDIVVTRNALPYIDLIYYKEKPDGKAGFRLDWLAEYLAFLETIVLHERILLASADSTDVLEPGDIDCEAYKDLNTIYEFAPTSQVNLEQDVFGQLRQKGLLYDVTAETRSYASPSQLVQYYSHMPAIARTLRISEEIARETERNRDRCHRLALEYVAHEIGVPLFLTERAARAQVPLRMAHREKDALSDIIRIENSIQRGVIEFLKHKLDSGSLNEIIRVEELGHTTMFPRTPIANQILLGARSPEDLLTVTLDLRRKYENFRKAMLELEEELFRQDLTLKEKQRNLRYLNELADELWPQKMVGYRQVTSEVSTVSNLALSLSNPFSLKDMPSYVNAIVNMPWELIRRYLRQRKIRSLLGTKHTFMNSQLSIDRISNLFGCPRELVEMSHAAHPIRLRESAGLRYDEKEEL